MEPEGRYRTAGTRRRRLLLPLCVLGAVALAGVIAAAVVLSRTESLRRTFLGRCEKKSEGQDCQKMWEAFEGAYVGRDPCNVSMEAYDPLIATVPSRAQCNRMMFWSKTKDVIHDFTAKRDCYLTMEDTLLGSVLDNLSWCGREGSKETFTTNCPGWTECVNNPVRSFWSRASAAFAEDACGDVTAMLNGSITTPFNPLSIFATIEVKRLKSPRVRRLTALLVTQRDSVSDCSSASLKNLQKELDGGINYVCQEVPQSRIEECSSDHQIPCGACW